MIASRVLLALALVTAFSAATPVASAGDPCLVGDPSCLVSVHAPVCVTEPCDPPRVCVLFGFFCLGG